MHLTAVPHLEAWKAHPTRRWALAWCDLATGAIYVRPGFITTRRVAHELLHVLEHKGNAQLHPGHGWHFCVRSWHALRLRDACCPAEILQLADELVDRR